METELQTVDKPISKIKLHKKTVSDKGMRCFDFGLKSYAQHDKDLNILSLENRKEMRRRSRFVGNGEENAAAEGSFP